MMSQEYPEIIVNRTPTNLLCSKKLFERVQNDLCPDIVVISNIKVSQYYLNGMAKAFSSEGSQFESC